MGNKNSSRSKHHSPMSNATSAPQLLNGQRKSGRPLKKRHSGDDATTTSPESVNQSSTDLVTSSSGIGDMVESGQKASETPVAELAGDSDTGKTAGGERRPTETSDSPLTSVLKKGPKKHSMAVTSTSVTAVGNERNKKMSAPSGGKYTSSDTGNEQGHLSVVTSIRAPTPTPPSPVMTDSSSGGGAFSPKPPPSPRVVTFNLASDDRRGSLRMSERDFDDFFSPVQSELDAVAEAASRKSSSRRNNDEYLLAVEAIPDSEKHRKISSPVRNQTDEETKRPSSSILRRESGGRKDSDIKTSRSTSLLVVPGTSGDPASSPSSPLLGGVRDPSHVRRRSVASAPGRRQSGGTVLRHGHSSTAIPPVLSNAQILIVRQVWKQLYTSKGPTVLGSAVLHRLMFKVPAAKEAFKAVDFPPGQFLNRDAFMKTHCKMVGELFDGVISRLENLHEDAIGDHLERIGRRHAQFGPSSNIITAKFWNVMAESFIDCTLEWGDKRNRTENVRKAWALVVASMVERIKAGQLDQKRYLQALMNSSYTSSSCTVGSQEPRHSNSVSFAAPSGDSKFD